MIKKYRPTVAQFIAAKIKESGKSQIEIAQACGWPKPNFVTMLKKGDSKLPLDKIGPMAKVLEVQPVYLYWLVMQEYYPETLDAIEHAIRGVMLTDHEKEIIEVYRDLTHGRDAPVELHVLGDMGTIIGPGHRILMRKYPPRSSRAELIAAA